MSQIRWCDPGGHAFSLNDPDRKEYAATGRVREEDQRERIDICGDCSKSNAMGIKQLGMPAGPASVAASAVDTVPVD